MLLMEAYVECLFFHLPPVSFRDKYVGNFRNEVIGVNEVYNEISWFHQTFLSCVLRVFKCPTQLGFISPVDLMFAWVARQCPL